MKFVPDLRLCGDFDCISVNRLPPRAYFIPFKSEAEARRADPAGERESSGKIIFLSGRWRFAYYSRASLVPETVDTDTDLGRETCVPSTWQRTGYEPPVYINFRYPFTPNPPEIPDDAPVSVYSRDFELENTLGMRYILTFLGVTPCVGVYLNGSFVGYSESGHNTAEFDISPYVRPGKNTVAAVVCKWSTATYLECQDMFRETGIFRDVYIHAERSTHIYDYRVKTAKRGDGWAMDGEISLHGETAGINVEVKLTERGSGAAAGYVKKAAEKETSFSFLVPDAAEWSAETPNLYELFILLSDSDGVFDAVRVPTGFRRVEIRGEDFLFNGRKIKFKGVNHHDTTPHGGYVMTPAELERDVRLMKEFNVNAVRTSHYPPDPLFIILCDIYGLYVVDEADIETHGCFADPEHSFNISDDGGWADRYLERVTSMCMRDRNHPSVTMWSLGNESGAGQNHDRCYALLKELDPAIPVHYEGAAWTPKGAYDVYSEMYTSVESMENIRLRREGDVHNGKPFFLCEYAHAMGVGPGGLTDYVDMFYSDDRFMGGCIWEWADHAVLHREPGAPFLYTYGGDHGERIHDSNFCVDGLFYPDRRPHTGAFLMKYAYRPVRAAITDVPGVYLFTNTQRFLSTENTDIKWELLKNFSPVSAGSVRVNIPPCESRLVDLCHPAADRENDWFINFTYSEGGKTVAREQIVLNRRGGAPVPGGSANGPYRAAEAGGSANGACRAPKSSRRGENTVFLFDGGEAVFCPSSGRLVSYMVDGREMLNPSPAGGENGIIPSLYRAPIDNDRGVSASWDGCGLDGLSFSCADFTFCEEADRARVRTRIAVNSKAGCLGFTEMDYSVFSDGSVTLAARLAPSEKMCPELPRFGIFAELSPNLRNAEYCGLGPYENLPDFCGHAFLGRYLARVEDMHEPYIKPQDNGNHGGTTLLSLTDGDGFGLSVTGEKPFSFSVHDYTPGSLCRAKHREDIRDEGTVALSVDGFVRGAGSASCGHPPAAEYTVRSGDGLRFSVTLSPKRP